MVNGSRGIDNGMKGFGLIGAQRGLGERMALGRDLGGVVNQLWVA